MAGLWQVSEDLDGQLVEAAHGQNEVAAWVHSSTALGQSNGERYSEFHDSTVVIVTMVLPVGTSVLDQLDCPST